MKGKGNVKKLNDTIIGDKSVCMNVSVSECAHVDTRVCMNVSVSECAHVVIRVCMNVCLCLSVHT